MKHQNITVLSISDPTGTQAPSAGANGHLGRLALYSDVQALALSGGATSINNVDPVAGNIDLVGQSGVEVVAGVGGQVIIRLYTPISASISNNVGTVERGVTVTSVGLNWTINKTEISQSLNQGIGSLGVGSRSFVHTPVLLTSDTTYTLTCNDGTQSANASTTVAFRQRRWWGTDFNATASSGLILSLANNEFSTSRAKSFTIDGDGEYIYYAYPSSFGLATFTVNGLLNTAWTLTVVSHTNASGFTENYNVYRTNTVQNGTGINIVVS